MFNSFWYLQHGEAQVALLWSAYILFYALQSEQASPLFGNRQRRKTGTNTCTTIFCHYFRDKQRCTVGILLAQVSSSPPTICGHCWSFAGYNTTVSCRLREFTHTPQCSSFNRNTISQQPLRLHLKRYCLAHQGGAGCRRACSIQVEHGCRAQHGRCQVSVSPEPTETCLKIKTFHSLFATPCDK